MAEEVLWVLEADPEPTVAAFEQMGEAAGVMGDAVEQIFASIAEASAYADEQISLLAASTGDLGVAFTDTGAAVSYISEQLSLYNQGLIEAALTTDQLTVSENANTASVERNNAARIESSRIPPPPPRWSLSQGGGPQQAATTAATGAEDSSGFLGGLGTVGSALGIGGLIAGAVGVISTKMAGDFQSSMTQLVTGAGEHQSNLAMVSQGILQMAPQVGEATQQLAAGMYQIESSGQHGAQALITLRDAAEGAKVGAASLADVANGVTTEMTDYAKTHLTAAQATNTLIAAVSEGKTHLGDLSNAMATVLPTAAAMGVKLRDVAGGMATMTAEGVPAADAATYLRQLLMALEAPGKAATSTLKEIGLTTGEVANEMKVSLPDTLKMITDHLKRKFPEGSAAYIAALKNIAGGSKQMQGILDLTGEHLSAYEQNVLGITDAVNKGGDSITGWSLVQADFNQKISQAAAGVQTLMIGIGEHLLPVAGQLVDLFTNDVIPALQSTWDWLQNNLWPAIQSVGTWIQAQMVPALHDFWDWLQNNVNPAVQNAWDWLSNQLVPALVSTWDWLENNVVPAVQSAWDWIENQLVPALESFWNWLQNNIISALESAWDWLNNHILPILQSVWDWIQNQLVPTLQNWYNKIQDTIGAIEKWNDKNDALHKALSFIWLTLQQLWGILTSQIIPTFNQTKDTINNQLIPAFKGIGDALSPLFAPLRQFAQYWWIVLLPLAFVAAQITFFIGALAGLATAIGSAVRGIEKGIGGIVQFFAGLVMQVSGYLQALRDLVTGNFGNIGKDMKLNSDGFKMTWSGAWNIIQAIWMAGMGGIIQAEQAFGEAIVQIFENLYNTLVGHSIVPDIVNGISSWFGKLPGLALGWGTDMMNNFITGIKNMTGNLTNTISGVATTIRSYLHFSKPDTGPLADADTYGKDFMELYATSLESGTGRLKQALSTVAGSMSTNISPNVSFPGASGGPSSLSGGGSMAVFYQILQVLQQIQQQQRSGGNGSSSTTQNNSFNLNSLNTHDLYNLFDQVAGVRFESGLRGSI